MLTVTVMPIAIMLVIGCVAAVHTRLVGPHLWGGYIYVSLVFTFLIFLNCSTTCFHYIKCDYIYDVDDSFLVKDYRLSCNGERYDGWLIYTSCMIVV